MTTATALSECNATVTDLQVQPFGVDNEFEIIRTPFEIHASQISKVIPTTEDLRFEWMGTGADQTGMVLAKTTMSRFKPSDTESLLMITMVSDSVGDDAYLEQSLVFQDPVPRQIAARIDRVRLPPRWSEEGVVPPTIDCKQRASEFCDALYRRSYLVPDYVAPSKEEGVFLVYRHSVSTRCLSVEIDNELDIVCQVYDANQTFLTLLVQDFTLDISHLVRVFNA